MALIDDLISYWKLDEASGNAIDAHGSNDLTDNNTVGAATGLVYGTARSFDASANESFSLADNADLSMGNIDCTFAAWVKLSTTGQTRVIIGKGGGSNGDYFLYYNTGADRFNFDVYGSVGYGDSGAISANNLGSPSTGTWYFVVGWHDATANTINIQVNNGTVDSTSHSAGIYDGADDFYISSTVSGQDMDGLIGPAMIWKRVLTSDERTDLYNSGAGLAYDDFAGGTTATPTTLALTITTYAPTVSAPRLVTPTTASLSLTGNAPTVLTPVLCTPTTLSLATTAYAPTVSTPVLCTPSTLALALTGYAPTVTAGANVTVMPSTLTLTLTTYAPSTSAVADPYANVQSIITRFP